MRFYFLLPVRGSVVVMATLFRTVSYLLLNIHVNDSRLFHAVGVVRQEEVNALQNKSKQEYFPSTVGIMLDFLLH